MKQIFLATAVFLSNFIPLTAGFAEEPPHFGMPAQDLPKEYSQKGELFTIKLVPKAKETRLYLVGSEVAKVKFSKISITGTIKVGENEQQVTFYRKKDYFQTPTPIKGDLDLKLKHLDTQKTEEIRFRLLKD